MQASVVEPSRTASKHRSLHTVRGKATRAGPAERIMLYYYWEAFPSVILRISRLWTFAWSSLWVQPNISKGVKLSFCLNGQSIWLYQEISGSRFHQKVRGKIKNSRDPFLWRAVDESDANHLCWKKRAKSIGGVGESRYCAPPRNILTLYCR